MCSVYLELENSDDLVVARIQRFRKLDYKYLTFVDEINLNDKSVLTGFDIDVSTCTPSTVYYEEIVNCTSTRSIKTLAL